VEVTVAVHLAVGAVALEVALVEVLAAAVSLVVVLVEVGKDQ
jgi:hypothetical protein